MFGILLLFSINIGHLQANVNVPTADLSQVLSAAQVLQSETCQQGQLHQFDLLDIEGQKVNKLLYLQVKSVLKDSRAKGLRMGLTSTFRDCAEQSSLRSSNCRGDTSLPAESCSPPTEKPGESLHNYGMAIDFKCDSSPIFGQSSCYAWLKANAAKYKLKEHKEEPWHWSFTGR